MYTLYYYREEAYWTFAFPMQAFDFAERNEKTNGTEYVVMDSDGYFVHKKDLVSPSGVGVGQSNARQYTQLMLWFSLGALRVTEFTWSGAPSFYSREGRGPLF